MKAIMRPIMFAVLAALVILPLSLQAADFLVQGSFSGERPDADGTLSGTWSATLTQSVFDAGVAASADGVSLQVLPLGSWKLTPNPIPPGSISYTLDNTNVVFRFISGTLFQVHVGGVVASGDSAYQFFGLEDLRVVYQRPDGVPSLEDQTAWGLASANPINYKFSGAQINATNAQGSLLFTDLGVVNDEDRDDDGLANSMEDLNANGIVDPGETDPDNQDTDGDGLSDGLESGIVVPSSDTSADWIPDADPSTTTNPLDRDSDADGIDDGAEDANGNGRVDEGESDPNDAADPQRIDAAAFAEVVAGPDPEGDIAIGYPVELEVGIRLLSDTGQRVSGLRATLDPGSNKIIDFGPACERLTDESILSCRFPDTVDDGRVILKEQVTIEVSSERSNPVLEVVTGIPEIEFRSFNNQKRLDLPDVEYLNDARIYPVFQQDVPEELGATVVGFRIYDDLPLGLGDWRGVVRVPKVGGLIAVRQKLQLGQRDCRNMTETEAEFILTCTPGGGVNDPSVWLELDVTDNGTYSVTATVEDLPSFDPKGDNNSAIASVTVTGIQPLVLRAIEITQALQDLKNSVPLYQGKKTVARVYLDDPDELGFAVSGSLFLSSGGLDILDGELGPLRTITPKRDSTLSRSSYLHILEFPIPTKLTSNFSSLDFRFELKGQGRQLACAEADAFPDCSVRVNLTPAKNPKTLLMTMGYWTDESFGIVLDRDESTSLSGYFRITMDGLSTGDLKPWITARDLESEIVAAFGQQLGFDANDVFISKREWALNDSTIRRRWIVNLRYKTDYPDATLSLNAIQASGGSATLKVIHYRDGGAYFSPSFADLVEHYLRLVTGVPAARVVGGLRRNGYEFNFKPTIPEVSVKLALMRAMDSATDPTITKDLRYAGYLTEGAPGGSGILGQSKGQIFSWYDGRSRTNTSRSPVRNVGLHELYHSYGKQHAVVERVELEDGTQKTFGLCEAEGRFKADLHPYVHRLPGTGDLKGKRDGFPNDAWPVIGPLNLSPEDEVWGFDTRFLHSTNGLRVVDPRATSALMSYCDWPNDQRISYPERDALVDQNKWPALNEYLKVADSIKNGYVGLPGNFNYVGPVTVFTGAVGDRSEVTKDANTVINMLGTITDDLSAPQPIDDTEPVEISLLDSGGNIISSGTVFPTFASDLALDLRENGYAGPDSAEYLTAILPNPQYAATSLVATRGGAELLRINASASTPVVTYLEPLTNSLVGNPLATIRWQASDADGDPLRAAVLLTRDDGVTWRTLAVDIVDEFLQVPTATLGATEQGRFRVVVTDGFNSAEVQSPLLRIGNSQPAITITQPILDRIESSDPIWLEAIAADVEDGLLDGADIAWSSSIDGPLGSGSPLEVAPGSLSLGCHVLTAAIEDSAGGRAEATVPLGSAMDCSSDDLLGTLRITRGNDADGIGPLRFTTGLAEPATVTLAPGESVELRLTADDIIFTGARVPGFDVSLTCNDPSGETPGGLPAGFNSVNLGVAETVECSVFLMPQNGAAPAPSRSYQIPMFPTPVLFSLILLLGFVAGHRVLTAKGIAK